MPENAGVVDGVHEHTGHDMGSMDFSSHHGGHSDSSDGSAALCCDDVCVTCSSCTDWNQATLTSFTGALTVMKSGLVFGFSDYDFFLQKESVGYFSRGPPSTQS